RGRFGSAIEPTVDFGVAIGEGKTRRAVVIRGGQIQPPRNRHAVGSRVIPQVQKVTVVDAVGMFVEKHEDVGRFWNLGGAEKLDVVRIVRIGAGLGNLASISHYRIHGVT